MPVARISSITRPRQHLAGVVRRRAARVGAEALRAVQVPLAESRARCSATPTDC